MRRHTPSKLIVLTTTIVVLFGTLVATVETASATTSAESTAVNWAENLANAHSSAYGFECLAFVHDAWSAANVNLKSEVSVTWDGNSYPDDIWGHITGGTTGTGEPSTPGALIFFSAGTGGDGGSEPSHVELYVGNNTTVSSEDFLSTIVHYETFGQHPRELGWWLPDGTSGGGSGPPPPATTSGPASVLNESTNLATVFAQGPNDSLDAFWDTAGGAWHGPLEIGGAGTTYSAPTATLNQSTNLAEVFAEGPYNSLYSWYDVTGGGWTGPVQIGAANTTFSAPTSTLNQSTNLAEVFAEGPYNSLYSWYDVTGGGWTGPVQIGAANTTFSAPTSTLNQGSNLAEVFDEGPSNSLSSWYDVTGGGWDGPISIGGSGTTYSAPTSTLNQGSNLAEVFAEGPSNSLSSWYDVTGGGWDGPISIGGSGTTYSAPTSTLNQGSNLAEVFDEGPSNSLSSWYDVTGGGWDGPISIGGSGTTYSAPTSTLNQGSNLAEVFDEDPNDNPNQWYDVSGGGWNGPIGVSGPLSTSQAPSLTSGTTASFVVGSASSTEVTAIASPIPALSEEGALPDGVAFADNGDGTATLSGTAVPGSGGTYPLTITAANGVNPNASEIFTLTVDESPSIISANQTAFNIGSPGSFNVTTGTGFPAPSITESGDVPAGVSITDNGNGTISIAGTPAAGTAGTYPLVLTASNGIGSPAVQNFTLTVDQAPAITSVNGVAFVKGATGSFTPVAAGFPAPSFTETGSLPTGVTFASGVLSGTPTIAGTFPITLTASNGIGTNATQAFTLTVGAISITTSSLPTGSVYSKSHKITYSATLSASGGNPPYKWSLASGSTPLPPGLKLSSAGVISGKATAAGVYPFTVQVVDTKTKKTKTTPSTQNTATKTLSINIS